MLLPHRFQKIGWVILIPSFILGVVIIGSDFDLPTSQTWEALLNNMALIGFCLGSISVTCSRERIEDELITKIRLDSLLIALYINYALLIVAALCCYEFAFLNVMIYNLFTIPLFFLSIFRYKLWRLRKEVRNEE